jgi:hypothetical protein
MPRTQTEIDKVTKNFICAICSQNFKSKWGKSKYCSDDCKHRAVLISKKKFRETHKDQIALEKHNDYIKNKDKHLLRLNNWLRKNKEKRKIYDKKYYLKNKHKRIIYFRDYHRDYQKKRKNNDPEFKLIQTLREQLNNKLKLNKVKKKNRALELLGIEIGSFKKYLENMFKVGMNWKNRGKTWHLDHIIPVSVIDLSKDENLKFAFNYKNFQPMFARENLKKYNSIFIKIENNKNSSNIE